MTNEEIFKLFLKKYRKFSYCKRKFKLGFEWCPYNYREVSINFAVNYLFSWADTEQGGMYWSTLADDWNKLIYNFNLEGTIDLEEVFK